VSEQLPDIRYGTGLRFNESAPADEDVEAELQALSVKYSLVDLPPKEPTPPVLRVIPGGRE
jgi:hypothetical protein